MNKTSGTSKITSTAKILYVVFWSLVAGVLFFILSYYNTTSICYHSLEESIVLGTSMFIIVIFLLPVAIGLLRCFGFDEQKFWNDS